MSNMKTPPATPMTRKLVKRMVEVEENLKEVLKGADSEYVIEIKIRKIPARKEFSPIHETTPIEDVQDKVVNNKFVELPKEDITIESPKKDVSPELQEELDISPESSLALALIEKEMIPSSRKLRRNGNRRSIKGKKFGSSQQESEQKEECKQMEILPKPSDLISEDPEAVSVSQDVIPNSGEATSIPLNSSSEQVEVLSEPVEEVFVKSQEEVLETVEEVLKPQEELLETDEVLAEPQEIFLKPVMETTENQELLEPQEEVSEPIENGQDWAELVSDCDDFTSDAEDVTFSEELTPDLFRSNIRSELAELAMELIGSEPALADLAMRLNSRQELSPEPQSELVSTPDLPDLAEVNSMKNEIDKIGVIGELTSGESSKMLSEVNNHVIADLTPEKEFSEILSEVKNEVSLELSSEKESPELLSEVNNEVVAELPSEKEAPELLSEVNNEVIAEIPSEKESPELENNEEIGGESEDKQVIFEEEKESSELLLSETNTEDREEESAEKQVILQEIVDNSDISIATLQEESQNFANEEEKILFVEESISETEDLPKQVSEKENVEIQKEETVFEEEKKIPNNLPKSISEDIVGIKKERNIFIQKKEPSPLVTHAPALIKRQQNLNPIETRYIGYIVVIFLVLFYILNLIEKSQAPQVYNV